LTLITLVAVRLLVAGVADVADALYATPTREKSIGDFLREAGAAGARFCAAWIASDESMIPECSDAAGATAFVARTLDSAWRALVF
jgi:uncharacterized protein